MFVHTVKLFPVRHRRVGVFFAPDPAHGNSETEFNLETYRMMARGTQIVRPGLATAGGQERYAIKSEIDGAPRMLPEVFAALWKSGEVPAEALPELLFRLGPEFSRPRDFEPFLARGAWHRRLGWVALATCAVLALAVVLIFTGHNGDAAAAGLVEYSKLTGAQWLAQPMRPNVFLFSTDPVQALATVPLDASGYAPPAERFDVPPPAPAGRANGYTLARVQAADEQRLVLVSDYERSLLPRVYLSGITIPAADLALPAAELGRASAGAQKLNASLILCNHVMPRQHASAGLWTVAPWLVVIFGSLFLLPFTIVSLFIWRRQAKRQRELALLRQRLGLPQPAAARSASVS